MCNMFILITFIDVVRILVNTEHSTEPVEGRNDEYTLIRDAEDPRLGMYDKPLPCFGCGIGWFSLLLGFVFPFMWYYATILYFRSYYHRDPRERAGLAASAIAVSANLEIGVFFSFVVILVAYKALICTIAVIITIAVLIF
ncbi:hypothetical protein Gohar_026201 [Gossypium harknessii]|uniref:60S ribosomal protein L18a-like protein n=1 Tax=Gossypium harknessii TaxID=34285 RepID=A0A7J9HTJ8_9ROSI|nr:hypothetical protein [Gossypium harknessii]